MNKETAEEKQLHKVRHSLSHLLATTVLEKWPDTKLGIGPVIENGFYYDFDFKKPISETDLPFLEEKIRELIKERISFKKKSITPAESRKMFAKASYKLQLANELIKDKKSLSIYVSGKFADLCSGPHVKNTSEINLEAFKLTSIAGAYWKGSEKNPMLTRIYGVAFNTKKKMEEYLENQAEAEKRDHRKLGKELKIFIFNDFVGPGLPLWLPNGATIIEELEKLAKEKEWRAGYSRVRTPHVAKEIMYKTSGHLPYYAESMYPPMVLDENGQKVVYYLKAMNCPHHHQIYASEPRSYRNLPLRLAEYGTCYRYEKSGELFGIMRVRSMQMNDAHIYCTEDQFAEEFMAVIKLYLEYFKIFDIKKYVMRLSTHSKKGLGKKYVGNEKLWIKTEKMVRDVMKKEKIPFIEAMDEAAFYGPKVDVEIWSAIGKEFTLATNQVDFAIPERFGLKYVNEHGKEETPLCIHRAPLSTHERFIGFLIEHYAGAFPTWLSPIQAEIIPVSEKHLDYAKKLEKQIRDLDIRAEVADANETLGKRIREAELKKIPYILVAGEREAKSGTINVRSRHKGQLGEIDFEKFLKDIKKEIEERK